MTTNYSDQPARKAYDKLKAAYPNKIAAALEMWKEANRIIGAANKELDVALDAALDEGQTKFDFPTNEF